MLIRSAFRLYLYLFYLQAQPLCPLPNNKTWLVAILQSFLGAAKRSSERGAVESLQLAGKISACGLVVLKENGYKALIQPLTEDQGTPVRPMSSDTWLSWIFARRRDP